MGMPEFCEPHGNMLHSCYICNKKEKVITIIPGVICPVYSNKEIPEDICDNSGCIMIKITSRTETYECTSCGWEFTNNNSNYPQWVVCSSCSNSEVRARKNFSDEHQKCLRCSSKKYKCPTCGNVGARCVCPGKLNSFGKSSKS